MSRTQQEVVDVAAKHLREQGERSMCSAGGAVCAYRGLEGRMCAIGCLIPDDRYKPGWEGSAVDYSIAWAAYGRDPGEAGDCLLLERLQYLHDNAPAVDFCGWVNDSIRSLCINFDLVYPEPN